MKKAFIVNNSIIKHITGTRISRTITVKMRSHPGAATVDICYYIKPELCHRLDVIIMHYGTNDVKNEINTVKERSY